MEVRTVLDNPRFGVNGRNFATLGWPAEGWAVVRLSAADQTRAIATSRAFMAEEGARGVRGVTLVRLRAAEPFMVAEVLADAWRNAYRGEGGSRGERRAAPNPAVAVS